MLDFIIGVICLAVLMGAYAALRAYVPHVTWRVLFLPWFIAEIIGAALSLALWISAFEALYRDVKYIIPFLSQVLMYATPVVYSAWVVLPKLPRWAAILFELNPLTGAVEGFRWSILGGHPPSMLMLIASAVGIAACLVGAIYTFRRMERSIVDLV
jgi:lipopolysaccharide transport system permease protein